ncbi:cystathionine beta-synthase-like [Convolutriloba macropyga]|uniref:cystathionine beta-synthase-like n=1 Tax=Convolutriloba macropyga TaxID=536237 RepID=UPI003F523F88
MHTSDQANLEPEQAKIKEIWSESFEWKAPDRTSRCTWHLGSNPGHSPHSHKVFTGEEKLKTVQTAVDLIGLTPLVRLNKIEKAEGLNVELWAKCEYMNAGGSIKDRIAKRMVEDAEKSGVLREGSTIIEPTSGNTGIGLALVAAVRGYRCIIVMPEKMSNEKVNILRALGAEIVRTPTAARYDSPESHISVAQKLCRQIENSVILDQYTNAANPLAHYDETAEEILAQMEHKIDAVVLSPGTGGTVTGIGRKLKEKVPGIKVVCGDPYGSILAPPEMNKCVKNEGGFYEVEGIGYDFIPTVLDQSVVDVWFKTDDNESFDCGRKLMREEGLLVGGSSGTILSVALQQARKMPDGSRVVMVFPDSIRNYMTKYLSDDWMIERSFMDDPLELTERWWRKKRVSDLPTIIPETVGPKVTCQLVVNLMRDLGVDQIPVVDQDGTIVGVATLGNIMAKIIAGVIQESSPVSDVIYRQFCKVSQDCTLGKLSKILELNSFALVVNSQKNWGDDKSFKMKEMIVSLVTQIDLLNFITNNEQIS